MNRFPILVLILVLFCSACGGSDDPGPSSRLIGGSVQGVPLSLTDNVSTFAGGTPSEFTNPDGMTTDGRGNLYVTDRSLHTISKIVIATKVVTLFAGTGIAGRIDGARLGASFNTPLGITCDGPNLFVADRGNNTIRKIVIATGVVTTLAGDNVAGTAGSSDNVTGTDARFYEPQGITTDGVNLYVSDSGNYRIRKIVIATGVVTTLSGTGTQGLNDGAANVATFGDPRGITTDGTNLYLADAGNHSIRKIVIGTGFVSTLAGDNTAGSSGALDNSVGTQARFNNPIDITSDGTNLYVADNGNQTIRKVVIATGVVTTVAGSAGLNGAANGVGPVARFDSPRGITTDGRTLFVGDENNFAIRKIE